MKKMLIVTMGLCLIMLIGGSAFAEEKGLVETVLDGCQKDIETYCKGVKPGEGRILACLYAYQDKLSNRCEYALYDAAAQLERAITALTYLASECKDDLKAYCSDVKPGEGRLINCIDKNMEKVSNRCKQAIKDVSKK
jgi:Cysteine rich repeat